MAGIDKSIAPEKPFLFLEPDAAEGDRKVEAADFLFFIFMDIDPEISNIFGNTPEPFSSSWHHLKFAVK